MDRPTAYQAYAPTDGGDSIARIDLVREPVARRTRASQFVERADGGIIRLGRTANANPSFFTYIPIGVDPEDPMHAIVTDVANVVDGAVKVTIDGGLRWERNEALTRLVTGNGTLLIEQPGTTFSQVHSIGFSPTERRFILIGTEQAGIIGSRDGGETWFAVARSMQIPTINSFFFDEIQGLVTLSSFGRGLWRMSTVVR